MTAICMHTPPTFYEVTVVATEASMIAGNDDLGVEQEEESDAT